MLSPNSKILIIEDEPHLAQTMVTLFLKSGFEVRLAASGETGIAEAATHKFDLIISDVQLLDIDGFNICRILKQNPVTHHIPIILATGSPSPEGRKRALESGAMDYFEKPMELGNFLAKILSEWRNRQPKS